MDLKKLEQEQLKLAKEVITKDEFEKIGTVAGVDQSFKDNKIISAIVVCDYKILKVIEKTNVILDVNFPYIPGFLFYREGPAIIEVFNKLKQRPDVLIVDANGLLHPRKIGMASQLGILLNQPVIGIAKNLFCGEKRDEKIYLDRDIVAQELKTKEQAKPIYVSIGHKISLKTALEIVKNCIRAPHKLPEPLHLAHMYAKNLTKNKIDL